MKIYGKNCIAERLKINPKSIREIFLEEGEKLSELASICKSCHIPAKHLSKKEFAREAKGIRSQGIIAEIGDFKYRGFDEFLEEAKAESPTILFLDNLNDPQNFGSILRTAACFGGFAVALPKYDSVEVTEAALRVACGGENYVPIIKVTNLSPAIDKAKECGYWVGGAVVEGGEDLRKAKLNFPLGLVIGSEGKGIRQGLVKHLDFKLTMPLSQARLSFNASIAAAIFCYEVSRQRPR